MTTVTNLTTAWSSDITTTNETVVQCRSGVVYLNWDAVAPANVRDGFQMTSGTNIVLPAGTTFRMSSFGHSHEVWYAEFTV